MSYLLAIQNCSLYFNTFCALNNVSLKIPNGKISGLIGPNGAGKTSLFNCINGLYKPSQGHILLNHHGNITSLPPHKRTALGITRTFQYPSIPPHISTAQAASTGSYTLFQSSLIDTIFNSKRYKHHNSQHKEWTSYTLNLLNLSHLKNQQVQTLTFVQKKQLEIARAITPNTKLLLLDEPATGLSINEISSFKLTIKRLQKKLNLSILMVEHNMTLALDICQTLFILNNGKLIANGTPHSIQQNKIVQKVYLLQ